jgi:glycosyltransferase involved in cell wall biosynthesis
VPGLDDAEIRESFLRYMPGGRTRYQWYLPWMPLATERHNLHDFNVVLSSTSAFAKGVLTRPDTLHISYCHTPTRYLWTDTHEYIAELRHNKLVKMMLPPLIHRLRMWDKMSVDRVDHFIANSDTVRGRIQKYYRRESDIVYPPVDTAKFAVAENIGDYFLSGGRLVPYKYFDILIAAFNRSGRPLKIFGTGPSFASLQKMARPNITFLGAVSDEQKAVLMAGAQAFLHPQIEDFGITPLESMAAGRPVIAYGVGGATETVIPGITGQFLPTQSWESVFDVVEQFDAGAWNSERIRAHALRFDVENFKRRIRTYVEEKYQAFQTDHDQCRLDVRF